MIFQLDRLSIDGFTTDPLVTLVSQRILPGKSKSWIVPGTTNQMGLPGHQVENMNYGLLWPGENRSQPAGVMYECSIFGLQKLDLFIENGYKICAIYSGSITWTPSDNNQNWLEDRELLFYRGGGCISAARRAANQQIELLQSKIDFPLR